MQLLEFAPPFVLGFIGGLHCVGMCGGIVAAVSLGGSRVWWPGMFTYQLSRVVTYLFLGLAAGLAGTLFVESGLINNAQKGLSIFAGLVMIFFAGQIGGWIPERWGFLSRIRISPEVLREAIKANSFFPWLVIGVINGLLPCGLVYAALAMALEKANIFSAALLMLAFGLGTLPWMLGVAWAMRVITPSLRGWFLKLAAVSLVLFGLFMIVKATPLWKGHHGDKIHKTAFLAGQTCSMEKG